MALPNDTAIQTRCLRSYVSLCVRCSVPGPGPGSYSMAPTIARPAGRMRVHCRLFVVAFSDVHARGTSFFGTASCMSCFVLELLRPPFAEYYSMTGELTSSLWFICLCWLFHLRKVCWFWVECNKYGKADRISFLNLAFPLPRPPFTEYSMTGDLWVDRFPSIHLLIMLTLSLNFTETCADLIRILIDPFFISLPLSTVCDTVCEEREFTFLTVRP